MKYRSHFKSLWFFCYCPFSVFFQFSIYKDTETQWAAQPGHLPFLFNHHHSVNRGQYSLNQPDVQECPGLSLESQAREPLNQGLAHCNVPDKQTPSTHPTLTGHLQRVRSTPVRRMLRFLRETPSLLKIHNLAREKSRIPISPLHHKNCVHPASIAGLGRAPWESRKLSQRRQTSWTLKNKQLTVGTSVGQGIPSWSVFHCAKRLNSTC